MTFDPHPMEVVFPGSHPAQLTTLTRRAELVEELGIDVFLVMPFTTDFMKLTPDRYVHELLVERLHVVEVVVGENFTFGKKAAGNVETLRKAGERLGFAVESACPWSPSITKARPSPSPRPTSAPAWTPATWLPPPRRWAAPHRVEGVVVRGDGRGRGLGFPTANVAPPMYSAIPADGVYAAWFTVLGHGPVTGSVVPGERYQAAVSVGTNPTFSGRTRTVEAFVLDSEADLYGQHVAVDFVCAPPRPAEVRRRWTSSSTAMGQRRRMQPGRSVRCAALIRATAWPRTHDFAGCPDRALVDMSDGSRALQSAVAVL